MICTGNYRNCGDIRGVSISGDRGKKVNWIGDAYPKLAPKYNWWSEWNKIKDQMDAMESVRFYVNMYYNTVLSKLDPQEVYDELDGRILLCYEEPELFCHRHIVASWLEKTLGVRVPEVMILGDKLLKIDRPSYIDETLERSMKTYKRKQYKALVKSDSKLPI